ncbi:MAG: hypothetical protein ACEY3A_00500 [Wolbachia sp.]
MANLEGQYYAGLNFGAGWGGGFIVKPSIVFGYHHDKNSQFELEVLSNVKSLKSIGASLLANYRFYPDLDIDPVKLYVSGGLGGYLQIVPFGFGGGTQTDEDDKTTTTTSNDGTITTTSDDETTTTTTTDSTSGAIVDRTTPGIYGTESPGQSLADKILRSISYKLKVGVDYELTPQIVGAVGITMGGQPSNFKPPIQIPDAVLELGVRYNF